MNRKLTLSFILPFLFSTAMPATAQSRSLDKSTALQTVATRILNDSPKPIVEGFRIDRNTSKVEQSDRLSNDWMADNKVQFKQTKVPTFTGELADNTEAFNNFMQGNIGKTVYLEIVFPESKQPIGYRSPEDVPYFSAHEKTRKPNSNNFKYKYHTYFMQQVGNGYTWKEITNYDQENRKLSGFFKVGEPKKKNEDWTTFDITFIPQ